MYNDNRKFCSVEQKYLKEYIHKQFVKNYPNLLSLASDEPDQIVYNDIDGKIFIDYEYEGSWFAPSFFIPLVYIDREGYKQIFYGILDINLRDPRGVETDYIGYWENRKIMSDEEKCQRRKAINDISYETTKGFHRLFRFLERLAKHDNIKRKIKSLTTAKIRELKINELSMDL